MLVRRQAPLERLGMIGLENNTKKRTVQVLERCEASANTKDKRS